MLKCLFHPAVTKEGTKSLLIDWIVIFLKWQIVNSLSNQNVGTQADVSATQEFTLLQAQVLYV